MYLSFLCFLLFQILIVGIYLVINGIPKIWCFISVIWNVCLKGLVKSLICSIVRVGIRNSRTFPKLVKLDPCGVANLLDVFESINFECKVYISLRVGKLILFDFAPESLKKSISRSGD